MRSGWHLSGIAELKRGGLDISGGPVARIKTGFFLTFRIMLSIGLAQLTAIFVSLLIFAADINSPIEKKYLEANKHLIGPATALVDAEIQRATESVTTESARVAALSAQVASLRQQEIDPSGNDPQIQQAQREVEQLIAQKVKADEDVRNAETFASNELGGIKGAAGNSGQAGRGLRYRAAIEQLTNAKARAQEITKALNIERDRLDALRKKIPPADDSSRQRSRDQRLAFEKTLDVENAELLKLKNELTNLTHGRESAIRRAIENAPDHVDSENGFLAQISELEQIAQKDTKIAVVIGLIDVISFGFELAAVLAKVTSYVPTTYSALLARDAYLGAVRTVDGMVAELHAETRKGNVEPEILPPERPPGDKQGLDSAATLDPFGAPNDSSPTPPKRGRGRPRKHPGPTERLQVPVGEKI